MLDILGRVPTKGSTHKSVIEASKLMRPGYKRQIDDLLRVDPTAREALGYSPRFFGSEASRRATDVGAARSAGTGGKKAYDVYAYSKSRKLGEYTTEQLEEIARNPITRESIWGEAIGTAPLERNILSSVALSKEAVKPGSMAPVFSKDIATAYGHHLINTKKAVESAASLGTRVELSDMAGGS